MHLIQLIVQLGEKGLGFWSLQEQMDATTPGGQLIFHIFRAFAEFERYLIRERTTAGRASSWTHWRTSAHMAHQLIQRHK